MSKLEESLKNFAHDLSSMNSVVKNLASGLAHQNPDNEIFNAIFDSSSKIQTQIKTLQEYLVAQKQTVELHETAGHDIVATVKHRFPALEVQYASGFVSKIIPQNFTRVLDLISKLFERAQSEPLSSCIRERAGFLEFSVEGTVTSTLFFEDTIDLLLCEVLFANMNGSMSCIISSSKKVTIALSLPIFHG